MAPHAVAVWDEYLAHGAALGVAAGAVRAIPLGAEDDHRAWSSFGGRWRQVRVRYPRFVPPRWGRHPAASLFIGLFWLALGAAALVVVLRTWPPEAGSVLKEAALPWARRVIVAGAVVAAVVMAWALSVVACSVPDLFGRRRVTGLPGGSGPKPVAGLQLARSRCERLSLVGGARQPAVAFASFENVPGPTEFTARTL